LHRLKQLSEQSQRYFNKNTQLPVNIQGCEKATIWDLTQSFKQACVVETVTLNSKVSVCERQTPDDVLLYLTKNGWQDSCYKLPKAK